MFCSRLCVAFVCALGIARPSFGEGPDLASVLRDAAGSGGQPSPSWEGYLGGFRDGLIWQSAYLEQVEGYTTRVFCFPKDRGMTNAELISAGQNYLAKYPSRGMQPFGVGMLFALREAYPCE